MPLSISDHLGVSQTRFDKTGTFDAVLDVDSKFFIDPHLVEDTLIKELRQSYSRIKKHFADILLLLKHSRKEGDRFWLEAGRRLHFPEVKSVCIGYSSAGTAGTGMGGVIRTGILRTAKEIVDAGCADPRIFELMGLFQENVGADRISDMIANIIMPDLLSYSENTFKRLKVKTDVFTVANSKWNLVKNPFQNLPIIMIPKAVLRTLPIAESWSDRDLVWAESEQVRKRVNRMIGETWKEATDTSRTAKETLRTTVTRESDVLRDLLKKYGDKSAEEYDFDRDPLGLAQWYREAKKATKRFPLSLTLPEHPTAKDVLRTVVVICKHFKRLVEVNGLNGLLIDKHGKPRHEEAAQLLFYGIADAYCAVADVGLTRESNGGRGPVDFKLSHGYAASVLVEAKLSSNKMLVHGYEVQLKEYEKAEQTKTSIFLIIDVGVGASRIADVLEVRRQARKRGKRTPMIIRVNAARLPSASKMGRSAKPAGKRPPTRKIENNNANNGS